MGTVHAAEHDSGEYPDDSPAWERNDAGGGKLADPNPFRSTCGGKLADQYAFSPARAGNHSCRRGHSSDCCALRSIFWPGFCSGRPVRNGAKGRQV